ncbi:MAG: UTP--glucose-1-phosphate uridylyltransferase [Candidatus Fournierella pullistercoris]|uniref:UTP--glucose-1-phosphate uridylyltransferase n=1 Tax=Candidatus Allofournierella pullistercoris TaxID=2838597 RepID=A0A948T366_9FIRM|nr:UTP--glucose-1-phosphate uridylyltransferase [Candidatus Fournierella pullistercoris]
MKEVRKVRKAIIPAAGLGTRVLPATKAMPKEMLPIVDKPAIQYIVEEAVRSGIEEILIILGRNKGIIEDHFDRNPELEAALSKPGKEKLLEECLGIAGLANIYFVRQKETLGLGHAVMMAKAFTADEPFVVMYGDDVIMGEDPAAAQLIRAYEAEGRCAVGIKEVPASDISKYSSLKVEHLGENHYNVTDMVEKPAPGKELSLFSILGRALLTSEIYEILAHTKPGAGGEIQLTDAMLEIARRDGMVGVDYTGKRYDMGNKLGIMQAQVETALNHKEIGEDFRRYLKELAASL